MPRRAFIPGLTRSLALMGCLLASTAGRAALGQPSNDADAPRDVPAPKQPSSPADDQKQPPEGADRPSQSVQRRLPGEVKPEVYYFKDKDGNLRPVPGVSLEQLVEWIRRQGGAADEARRPGASLQEVRVSGEAEGNRANLTIEVVTELSERGWHRVPLRLSGIVLRSYSGNAEQLLDRDEDGQEFVAWLRSDSDGFKHILTLKAAVPLTTRGAETQLSLDLPRATASHIELEVPVGQPVARVSEGSTLEMRSSERSGQTRLLVQGASGPFELSWRGAEARPSAEPAALEANGALLVAVDSRTVSTDARLSVRSLAGPVDEFQIRLPPRAELVGGNQPGISLIPLEGPADQPRLVLVKLQKRTAGPLEVRLVTERLRSAGDSPEQLELAGFEVVGAVRQWGHVAIRWKGNWHVDWETLRHVRATDELPASLRSEEPSAGFEYLAAPFTLTGRLVARTPRISVLPEYIVQVGAERVHLEARLRYQVRGGKISAVAIGLPGWEVQNVGPVGVVDDETADQSPSGELTLPLSQSLSGEFEVTFEAHRPVPRDLRLLELPLPRPVAAQAGPSDVVILPDDDIELTPRQAELQGLAVHTLRPAIELPRRQQEPFYYRTEGALARFVAERTVHRQVVASELVSRIAVNARELLVEQEFNYKVQYEPIARLSIAGPASIASNRVQFLLDGRPVAATQLGATAGRSQWRVELPRPRIGQFQVKVAYTLPQALSPRATSTLASVPLHEPRDASVSSHRAVVTTRDGLTVSIPKGPWTTEPRETPDGDEQPTVATSAGSVSELRLAIEREPERATAMIVERCWVQSWLSDTSRQDRAVFRISSPSRTLQFTLPEGVEPQSLQTIVDGVRMAEAHESSRSVTISLPQTKSGEDKVVELRYRFARRPPRGAMRLEPPQFSSAVWLRQVYWELVLPANEHLAVSPAGMTREWTWNWMGWCWQRQAVLSQADLEAWSGGAPSLESVGTNRYLLSATGELRTMEASTAGRTALVLGASLPSLLLGLALLYWPRVRRPVVAAVAAIVVLALALVDAESTLVLGQSAALGVALVAIALVLRRRSRWVASTGDRVRGSSISPTDRTVSGSKRGPRPGTLTSTAPASLAAQGSSGGFET